MSDDAKSAMPAYYDRLMGSLDGLPDVIQTKPSTIRDIPTLGVGGTQTFIVQTFRQHGEGDTIFLDYVSGGTHIQIVIPAKVANTIASQRDALTAKSRSKAAKAAAQERKDRGELPGFMKARAK